ncbi:MAG: hypothetical protein RLZZ70_681 [Candidatus Parcubacteria bacterium]|jgi:hypothetical protein
MRFIILFLLFVPNLSFGCLAGPQAAPGYGFSGYISEKSKTDAEKDEEVWVEMGYFDVSPSGWGEIENISEKYYNFKVSFVRSGSCGPESVYIYKTLLNYLAIGLAVTALFAYLYSMNIFRQKRS